MRFLPAERAFALVVLLCIPSFAAAQSAAPQSPCRLIPDTAVVPSAQQVQERQALRLELDSVARAAGVAEPQGILFVDVDSARAGKVLFIDANLPPEAVPVATRYVADYLSTLERGRAYQALIRLDADYVAPAPGKRSCAPVLLNRDELGDLMQRVMDHHPESGRHQSAPVTKRALVRLVVNRSGKVSYVEVVQPTGDPALDSYLEALGASLRFEPARLDDVPYDVRFRFAMTFTLR
jgi:TonB family protein